MTNSATSKFTAVLGAIVCFTAVASVGGLERLLVLVGSNGDGRTVESCLWVSDEILGFRKRSLAFGQDPETAEKENVDRQPCFTSCPQASCRPGIGHGRARKEERVERSATPNPLPLVCRIRDTTRQVYQLLSQTDGSSKTIVA
ncbi:hypothetical protein V2G26_019715 [Clonostachys chloroleuca]